MKTANVATQVFRPSFVFWCCLDALPFTLQMQHGHVQPRPRPNVIRVIALQLDPCSASAFWSSTWVHFINQQWPWLCDLLQVPLLNWLSDYLPTLNLKCLENILKTFEPSRVLDRSLSDELFLRCTESLQQLQCWRTWTSSCMLTRNHSRMCEGESLAAAPRQQLPLRPNSHTQHHLKTRKHTTHPSFIMGKKAYGENMTDMWHCVNFLLALEKIANIHLHP